MIQHHFINELNQDIMMVLKEIVKECFQLGLKQDPLIDMVKFLMSVFFIVLFANDGDDKTFGLRKNEMIGRYFGYKE